ncbi:MAG: 50S ribosomal protein L22 [Nanoarchaeota archaeon]
MVEAKVIGRNLQISAKHSVEIGSFIRNRRLDVAKNLLKQVVEKKVAVPFKRYNRDTGHKAGIAAGQYPIKASEMILRLLNSVEKNAIAKGMNASNLIISFFSANKGGLAWHYGRKRGRKMKNTHIEIRVKEKEEQKKDDRKTDNITKA